MGSRNLFAVSGSGYQWLVIADNKTTRLEIAGRLCFAALRTFHILIFGVKV